MAEEKTKDSFCGDDFYSLSPTDHANDYDLFDDILSSKLGEKYENGEFRNKNIAITGLYGSGKSSLIKTYLKNHNLKSIIISLGQYSKKANNTINFSSNNIENSLLQQIIYNTRPNKLPFSRIARSDVDVKNNNKIAAFLSLFITIIIIITNYFSFFNLYIKHIEILENNNYLSNSNIMAFLLIIVISSLITYFLLFSFLKKIKLYGYIKRFIIKGNEIELDEQTTSILSKSLDELIHFFMMTKYDTVIIEDVDRIDNSIEIFTKLKEINSVINNSINGRTIRFIYEINDSIFDDSESRTKFFDVIIPIASYTAPLISDVMFYELFKNSNIALSLKREDYVYVGSFIRNSRTIYDIYNEFMVYYSLNRSNMNSDEIKKLYYLVSYKVLFPKRFDNFLLKKGILSYFISEDYKEDLLNYYRKTKSEWYEKELIIVDSKIKEKNEKLKKELIDKIEGLVPQHQNVEFFDNYNSELLFNLEELKSNFVDKINILQNRSIYIKNNGEVIREDDFYPYGSKSNFFEKYFFDELDDKKLNYQLNQTKDLAKSYYDIKDENIIKDFNKKVQSNESYNAYRVNKNLKNNMDNDALIQFEKHLLEKKYVSNVSAIYFTVQKGTIEEIEDKILLNDLINGKIYDVKTKINDIDNFYELFSKELIKEDSFCLLDIYKKITNDPKGQSYINDIFNNLSYVKVKNLVTISEELPSYLSDNNLNCIWNYLGENFIDFDIKNYYIIKTIQYGDPSVINNVTFFEAVNLTDSIDDLFELYFDLIKNKYKLFNFDLKQSSFNNQNIRFLNYVFDNNLFNSNIALFNASLISKGYEINNNKLIESYYKTNNNQIIEYMQNNIHSIIEYINRLSIKQNDSDKYYKKVIRDLSNDFETIESLLLNEEKNIYNVSGLEESFLIIDSLNKYKPSLSNLYDFYKYNKERKLPYFSENMIKNINQNYESIVKNDYKKKYYEMLYYIITKIQCNNFAYKSIADYFFFYNTDVYISDDDLSINSDNYDYLVSIGRLYGSALQVNEKYDNYKLSNEYLRNSFRFFTGEKQPLSKTSVINGIFSINEISDREKIEFVLKYLDLFDNQTYENLFNLLTKNDFTDVSIPSIVLINSMKKHHNIMEVVQCIMKYKKQLSFDDIKEILINDKEFRTLINKNKGTSQLSLKKYNQEFITYLCDISDGKFTEKRLVSNKTKMSLRVNY